MKKTNLSALFLMAIAPFVMSMTCTHVNPQNPPTTDAPVVVVDASTPTTDGAPAAQPCGIPADVVDAVSNAAYASLQDAKNSQTRLNTLASQYTTASITCLLKKIVAGTPNADQTVTRANTWLGSVSAKKALSK